MLPAAPHAPASPAPASRPAPRARALITALALACAAATVVTADVAAAAPAAASSTAVTRRAARSRAKARARAKVRAKAHAKLHARLHAKAHARRHAHLHALTTVADLDAGPPDESETSGASLRGSHAAVDRAFDAAVTGGIPFVHSESELEHRASDGEYVPLARATPTYQLKGVGSAYVRPATRDFVTRFAADYARECGEPLTVTSAMRPTTVHLRNSVQKSVHPTGMAVDLRASRTGCLKWMRETLLDRERDGTIDATEEHHPAHFHVVVLRAP